MKVMFDNHNHYYDVGDYDFVFDFNTKLFPFLKKYAIKFSLIEYNSEDPNYVLVQEKHTEREYHQLLHPYNDRELINFLKELMEE